MTKKGLEKEKLIWQITEEYSVYAGKDSYVLRIKGKPNDRSYYPSLDILCQDLFDQEVRNKLIENKDKTIHGVIRGVLETKKWIKNILEPLMRLDDINQDSPDRDTAL